MSISSLTQLNALAFLQRVGRFFDGEMTTPTTFGWFHILWLILLLGGCILAGIYARKLSDKRYDQILWITSILLIVLEAYKQFNFSYDWETNTWDYRWYAFPYQFCSTPMYVMPLALIFRKKRLIRDACRAYLATYALFAGLAVMIYPGNVFIETIGVNIQTMIHHGGMVFIGVLTWVSGKAKLRHDTIVYALPVFATLFTVAMGANILWYYAGNGEEFNMFYISPYYECILPILNTIQAVAPYPVFLIGYFVGFTVAGYIMFLLALLIKTVYLKIQNKRAQPRERA